MDWGGKQEGIQRCARNTQGRKQYEILRGMGQGREKEEKGKVMNYSSLLPNKGGREGNPG